MADGEVWKKVKLLVKSGEVTIKNKKHGTRYMPYSPEKTETEPFPNVKVGEILFDKLYLIKLK